MRALILLSSLALLYACAASQPAETEYVTRIGTIKAREVVEPEARSDSRVTTGVGASVSRGGGGSGVSIGLGFLFSPWSESSSEAASVRYRVELLNGEQITVDQQGDKFEVNDCVEVSSPVGDDSVPPLMKRIAGGC